MNNFVTPNANTNIYAILGNIKFILFRMHIFIIYN